MHGATCLLLAAMLAGANGAETVLRHVTWPAWQGAGNELPGELLPADATVAFDRILIENTHAERRAVHLLSIDEPSVTESRYALRGQVKYEDVEGDAYFELLNQVDDGREYFTRSLAKTGPLRPLSGSCDWRAFELPLDLGSDGRHHVERLDLNLVLPGRGKVWVGPLELVQFAGSAARGAAPGAWWGARSAGWIGGLAGSLVGCIGGLIGLLVSRGWAEGVVKALLWFLLAAGVAALMIGIVALILRQPYAVYYPLLLLGFISVVVSAALMPVVRRRYQQIELQRMSAADAA